MILNTASSIQQAVYFRRLTHFLKAFSAICCDWKNFWKFNSAPGNEPTHPGRNASNTHTIRKVSLRFVKKWEGGSSRRTLNIFCKTQCLFPIMVSFFMYTLKAAHYVANQEVVCCWVFLCVCFVLFFISLEKNIRWKKVQIFLVNFLNI